MITIEEIDAKKYTVVWTKYSDSSSIFTSYEVDSVMFATHLPALPRNPKLEDAPLLYRYMGEGIDIYFEAYGHGEVWSERMVGAYENGELCLQGGSETHLSKDAKISHATYNGEQVNIAIKEAAND